MAKQTPIKIQFKTKGMPVLLHTMAEIAKKAAKESDVSAVVGYATKYALYVHEDLHAYHPVGQAKYLETPARLMVRKLTRTVVGVMRKNGKLSSALLTAAIELKKASVEVVPIDTGALKKSAFTGLDRADKPLTFSE